MLRAGDATAATPVALNVERLSRELSGMYRFIAEGPPARERWCLLDTFDWRLYRKGVVCVARAGFLELRAIPTMEVELSARYRPPDAHHTPLFPAALQPSSLRDQLLSLAGVRALLVVGCHEVRVGRFRVTDDIEKVVAVATLAGAVAGFSLLTIAPLKGYAAEVDRLCDAIRVGNGTNAFPAALLANSGNRVPGLYSTRVNLALNPEWTCAEAMRAIVGYFSWVLAENTPGILADWDAEFLHDYRVALRRLRTAVTLSRAVLTGGESDRMKSDLRLLESFTGPVRDLDVLLLHESEYHALLPPELQSGADEFFSRVRQRRAEAYEALTQSMADGTRDAVLRQWKQRCTGTEWPSGKAASRPVRLQARRWIGNRVARINVELTRAELSDDPEILHELRLDCKKLRYLLEVYGSLFPTEVVRPLTRQLRAFQDTLGRLQDLVVQAQTLTETLQGIESQVGNHVQVAASLGGLLHELTRRRPRLMAAFRDGVRPFHKRTRSADVERVFTDGVGGTP